MKSVNKRTQHFFQSNADVLSERTSSCRAIRRSCVLKSLEEGGRERSGINEKRENERMMQSDGEGEDEKKFGFDYG